MADPSERRREAEQNVADIADQAKRATREKASALANAAHDTVASKTEKVSDAARAAANELDPSTLQAEALHKIADRVDQVAAQIRQVDLETAARQASDFARRNPALFIGGAFLAGFAATRFLKADPSKASTSSDDPWGGSFEPAGGRYNA